MSDFVHWLNGWLLEIPEIDHEHKELVDLLNRLALCRCDEESACVDVDIMALLEEIGLHTRRHFKHEEAFMRESAYPGYEDHRYEHMTLLAEYAELVRHVRSQGVECLDANTLLDLKGWLISHIAGSDRRFGDYHRRLRTGAMGHGQDRFDRYWIRRAGDH